MENQKKNSQRLLHEQDCHTNCNLWAVQLSQTCTPTAVCSQNTGIRWWIIPSCGLPRFSITSSACKQVDEWQLWIFRWIAIEYIETKSRCDMMWSCNKTLSARPLFTGNYCLFINTAYWLFCVSKHTYNKCILSNWRLSNMQWYDACMTGHEGNDKKMEIYK